MLCLVVALLLFAKKKGTRNLAWMAAPTVAFNISEIVLFGIPIILNPIFVVPFMLVPLANFLITYAAIYSIIYSIIYAMHFRQTRPGSLTLLFKLHKPDTLKYHRLR